MQANQTTIQSAIADFLRSSTLVNYIEDAPGNLSWPIAGMNCGQLLSHMKIRLYVHDSAKQDHERL